MRQEPAATPVSVRDAVLDVVVLQDIDRGVADGKTPYDAAADLLLKNGIDSIPIRVPRFTSPPTPAASEEPTPIAMPEEPITKGVRRGRNNAGKSPLTDEQRREIADAFAAGMSTTEIVRAYDIGTATLYAIVRKAGLPLRGRPGSKPAEVQMTNTAPYSPPEVLVAPVNGTGSGLTEWTVTYRVLRTETRTVAAKSFNDAAAAVESADHGGESVEVVSVARA